MESRVNEFHTRMVLSSDPETMYRPLGEQLIAPTISECPLRGLLSRAPVLASQIRMVLSTDPEMICCPSGEYATDVTQPVWPSRGLPIAVPVLAFPIRVG